MLMQPVGPSGKAKPLLPESQPFAPPPDYVLPPLPEIKPGEGTLTGKPIRLREIKVQGVTVLNQEEIRAVTDGYLNREVTLSELFQLKDKLTLLYINQGYVTSGFKMDSLQESGGSVIFQAVEGRLAHIDVRGAENLSQSYVADRLARGVTTPLNIKSMEERFQLLRQDSLIAGISSELRPGVEPGEANLHVRLTETRPFDINLLFHNQSSPGVGSTKGEVALSYRSLFGFGETYALRLGRSEGVDDYGMSLSVPLNTYDTSLHLFYENGESTVVSHQFRELDITSETTTWGAKIRQPVWQTPSDEVAISLGYQRRTSETALLGQPFSFSEGVVDGKVRVPSLNLEQEWTHREQRQVLALQSTFSKGLSDAGNGTMQGPDSRFFAWLGQGQWVRRLEPWDSLLVLRGAIRLTDQGVLATEKFSLGGMQTVRGYRENLLARDEGWVVSAEWRLPTPLRLPLPLLAGNDPDDGLFSLAVFGDYGKGWDKNTATVPPEDLSSVGIGVLYTINRKSTAQLYLADRLRNVAIPGELDRQDHGIHFRLNISPE